MEATGWLIATITSLLLGVLLKELIDFRKRCKTLPPGPWSLPFVGYLPCLRHKFMNEIFDRLGKKYGAIFSFKLGNSTMVVFNDWESIRAAFVDKPKIFSGRPDSFIMKVITKRKGNGYNDGSMQAWRTQRNLTLKTLRNLGMGKKSMEGRLTDMAQEVMDTLSRADGQVIPIKNLFFDAILKVTWRLVLGDEFDENQNIQSFKETIQSIMKIVIETQTLNTFPWLRHLPSNKQSFKHFVTANTFFGTYLMKMIHRNMRKLNEDNLDNFVDSYLADINKNKKEGQPPEAPYTIENLMGIVIGLFAAGTTTINETALRGLLYLAHRPEVQKRAQEEIDSVIGSDRLPSIDDMSQLPYVDAFVMELQRHFTSVSLVLAHKATESTKVLGYSIPKGTSCVPNLSAVHRDPRLWDEPEAFKPERFIDKNNKAIAPPYLIPFSIGPRICLGQSLAEMELRIIFTCLLQQFTFEPDPQNAPPTFHSEELSQLYSLKIRKRKM